MRQNDPKNKYGAEKRKNYLFTILELSLCFLFIFSAVMTIIQAKQAKHEQESFSD